MPVAKVGERWFSQGTVSLGFGDKSEAVDARVRKHAREFVVTTSAMHVRLRKLRLS